MGDKWLFEKCITQGIKPDLRKVSIRALKRKDGKIAIMTTLTYKNNPKPWHRRAVVTVLTRSELAQILVESADD